MTCLPQVVCLQLSSSLKHLLLETKTWKISKTHTWRPKATIDTIQVWSTLTTSSTYRLACTTRKINTFPGSIMLYAPKHLCSIVLHFGQCKYKVLRSRKEVLKWNRATFLRGYRLNNCLAKLNWFSLKKILLVLPLPEFSFHTMLRNQRKSQKELRGISCPCSECPLANLFSASPYCKSHFMAQLNFYDLHKTHKRVSIKTLSSWIPEV